MSRYNSIINLYGKDNYEIIKQAKVLIVGAGGIGCEVIVIYTHEQLSID